MELKKTSKRIVSKSEYVSRLSKKTGLASFGRALYLLCLISAAVMCLLLFVLLIEPPGDTRENHLLLFTIVLTGALSLLCGYLGWQTIGNATQMDIGIPLTHATTTDLLAKDSPVRASEEPTPEQQAILLRAAALGQETPAEELVRPTTAP